LIALPSDIAGLIKVATGLPDDVMAQSIKASAAAMA